MKRSTRSKPEVVKVGNVTVKLYKRKRRTAIGKTRTVYEIADYTSGTRRFVGFSDHTKAVTKAKDIAQKIASGDVEAASMTNTEAASYGRGSELLRPTGISLEAACTLVAKHFEILGGDYVIESAHHYKRTRPDQVTQRNLADVVAELVALKKSRGLSDDYTNDLRQRLTRFADKHVGEIHRVTTADVQRFLDGLGLGTQSVKNFRTVIGTLFEFAEARGYIAKGCNPVTSTETVKVKSGDIEIFTLDEITKLLKAASEDFLPLVAIGAFAGLRSAEAERIEWNDIDLAGGFIHVAKSKAKTKARRLVPILPNLAQWLAPYSQRTGKIWKTTDNDLQDARATCIQTSGVAWKNNALRHSFASYRLAATQNAAQVALEMGNSADVVFKHYRELVKPETAKAWFAVSPEQPANVTNLSAAKGN